MIETLICITCELQSECNLNKCCKNCHEEDCQERHCLLTDPFDFEMFDIICKSVTETGLEPITSRL